MKVVSSQWLVVSKSGFGFVLCAMLIALGFPADTQQPKKVSRIGYLSSFQPASESACSEGIRLALSELGYIERTEHRHRVPICGGEV